MTKAEPEPRTGFDNGMVALEGRDLLMIGELLTLAAEAGSVVLVAIDDGLKVKADQGTWSPPIGAYRCAPCARGYHINHPEDLTLGCTRCPCTWGAPNV